MKYSLSMREILRTEPNRFSEGSRYIPTRVIIETLSNSNNLKSLYCPSPESNIGIVDSPYCPGSWEYIFPYRPSSTGRIRAVMHFTVFCSTVHTTTMFCIAFHCAVRYKNKLTCMCTILYRTALNYTL